MTPPPESSIAVIDYGLGNVGSVLNMLRRLEVPAFVSRDPAELSRARALILPGVGHFDEGMKNLRDRGLVGPLTERVRTHGTPVLGICLGMQLLGRSSEEGDAEGLGWMRAKTVRFRFDEGVKLPIPHMGWNDTECLDRDLFGDLVGEEARFYFVHSFHVVPDDPGHVAARCTYGRPVVAAVRDGNVFGTQFHPEKSHRFGKRVLAAYAKAALQ